MNYQLNDNKMFADVTDGIAVIINSETGIYYGLNGFGTNVYENIIAGVSSEEIIKSLIELPNIPSDIENSFNKFIQTMLEKEILVEAMPNKTLANINTNIAKDDNYELKIDEYSDAQELLLADPIHEVKENTGWTPEKDSIGYTKEETKNREKKMEA